MHSNLATFMIEQLQDKNHDSNDVHQNKEQDGTCRGYTPRYKTPDVWPG